MSCDCSKNKCCTNGSHHHACERAHESCCQTKDKCHCECNKLQKYSDQILNLADQAWREVLKEKIKQEIARHSGEHLDQMAKLIAETNHRRWVDRLQEKQNMEEFDSQLKAMMCKKNQATCH